MRGLSQIPSSRVAHMSLAGEHSMGAGFSSSGRGPGIRMERVPEGDVSSTCRSPRDVWSRERYTSTHSVKKFRLGAATSTVRVGDASAGRVMGV